MNTHQLFPPYVSPRRRRHDGAAVDGIAARSGATRPERRRGASEAPVRLAVLFSGNGFHSSEWWAKGTGKDMELGKVLDPLADFREKMLVHPRPLTTPRRSKGNIHSSQTGNLLSGAPLASGGEIRSGTSIDQLLAQRHGRSTKVPSLVLGLREVEPVGPQELLDALQLAHLVELADDADAARALPRAGLRPPVPGRGAAEATRACSTRCSPTRTTSAGRISTADQRKLDEYLDSVREVEQRIERAGKAGELQGWRPTLDKPNIPRPADGIPQDIAEHMRLMCDILVLGFQTDTTRICTLKLNNDHSSLRFPNLGVDYMIHHLLSHSDTADWLKVNQFFVKQVAYIARKLDAIHEGERTALDNSMIMLLLEHAQRQPRRDASCPWSCSAAPAARSRAAACSTTCGKPNRKMCSLYLSLLDKAGVHLDKFGDSTERLAEV